LVKRSKKELIKFQDDGALRYQNQKIEMWINILIHYYFNG
jgi:hypothetical protein